MTQVPIQENSFDVSIVRYVLQWNSLKRQKEIIREIARTTKNFAVIQHPAVETTEQEKLQRLFDGTIVSKLKRSESFYSTKEQMEDIFRDNGLSFELIDSEFIKDASDVFIERYELTPEESRDLKYFLGSDDWWNRTTWVVWK